VVIVTPRPPVPPGKTRYPLYSVSLYRLSYRGPYGQNTYKKNKHVTVEVKLYEMRARLVLFLASTSAMPFTT